jgi:hypothetical protein
LGRTAHCPEDAALPGFSSVTQTQILVGILILFVVEVNHLKWIWWNHWQCRKCGVRNRSCACSDKWKWMVLL